MSQNRIKGTLKSYLRWPLLLGLLLIAMNVHIYITNLRAGIIMSIYVLFYLIIASVLYFFKRGAVLRNLVDYSMRFHVTVNKLATELDIPICILDTNGVCVWDNKNFRKQFSDKLSKNYHINDAIPALTKEYLPEENYETTELHFHVEETYFKAITQLVSLEKAPDALHKNAGQVGIGDALYVIYIYDETEIVHYIRENYDQRVNVGLLYIDNYDESLANVDDVRRSLLAAMVDRKINKYMLSIDAITRKIEKDKYIFLFQHNRADIIKQREFVCLQF